MTIVISPHFRLIYSDTNKQYTLQTLKSLRLNVWGNGAYVLNEGFLRAVVSRPSLGIPDTDLLSLIKKLPPSSKGRAEEEYHQNMRMRSLE